MIHEPTTADQPHEFPGRRLAIRLGAGLLLALVLTLGLVMRDHSRRSTLETISEVTAVGDLRHLAVPVVLPPKPFPSIAQLDGRRLAPTSYERAEKREADMRIIGRDTTTGLTIYQSLDRKTREPEPDTYYLKSGPGEFVKVRPIDTRR